MKTKHNGRTTATEDQMKRMLPLAAAIAALMLTGCPVSDQTQPGSDAGVPTADGSVPTSCMEDPARVDVDGDGWCPSGRDSDADGFCCSDGESLPPEQGDCNDTARVINPGATEVCGNGVDEDCGESPCATPGSCPDPDTVDPQCGGTPACAPGLTRNCATSCGSTTGVQPCRDDGTWGACAPLPGEICGNGQDDNCNGSVDEGCTGGMTCVPGVVQNCPTSCGSSGTQTCQSGGTWGACSAPSEICGNGRDDDCDGTSDEGCSSSTLCTPGATVTCPTSCGSGGSQTCAPDGMSYGACTPPSESCGNSRDDDCDGIVDDGCASGMVCIPGASASCPTTCGSTGFQVCAADGGSYGACTPPSESCGNSRDDDCDGLVDDGCGRFYRDADGDGYGRPSDSVTGASAPPGYVSSDGDCDDTRSDVNPGRSEVCGDSRDNDCDGAVDEGCLSTTYYRDADGDGYGTSTDTRSSSGGAPSGYVALSGDCNDSNASVNPGRSEVCGNAIDDNCNGSVDEGCSCSTYYRDADGDGYGTSSSTTTSCTGAPSGYVSSSTDCNDSNASVNPGRSEVCGNAIDDNCNGSVDEGCSCSTYYRDADGDGYGTSSSTTTSCTGAPSGYVSMSGDCDDGNSARSPGRSEICSNGVDEDCDGTPDDGCSGGTCGASRTLDVSYSVSTPSTATVSSSSRIRWNFWFGCGAATVARETGVSSASFSVDMNSGEIRKFNGEIFSPAPSGTLSTGEPISQWLCQEPRAGEPRAPFGAPTIRDGGRTYVYDGVLSPGATIGAGHMAIAHDGSILGGWGCNFFLCPFDGSSCRIP